MLPQPNQNKLNQLPRPKNLQLLRLNQQPLKRTRLRKSKRKVTNSLLKQIQHKRELLKVLRLLQKSLLVQLQRLEPFTEEERQELKLLRRELLLEAHQLLKPNLLMLLLQRHNQPKLNLPLRLLKPLLQRTPNLLSKSNQPLLKTSQKLPLKPNRLKAVLKLIQQRKPNNSEGLMDQTDP
jgi:hypothetical protein